MQTARNGDRESADCSICPAPPRPEKGNRWPTPHYEPCRLIVSRRGRGSRNLSKRIFYCNKLGQFSTI